MEPQIQYCRTSEGKSIAYRVMGSGPALITTPQHLGMTIARDLEAPASRRIAELTARNFTFIRFDLHGSGLSDRNDDDLSVESFVRDIEAVADAAAPDTFALFANGALTAPAIVYAARHPERLTHLLLWMVFAHAGDFDSFPNKQMTDMALSDWRLATESGMRAVDNWEHEELASEMASMMRDAVTPETFVKFENARLAWDVGDYLPQVSTPTLIIHPRNHPYYPPGPAQRAAAEIPGARLALIESSTVLFPDVRIAALAGEFLGATRTPRRDSVPSASGTAIIMFADIVDSTALTERLGDAAFRERARSLDERLRAIIGEHGGAAIEGKLLGDGVLATFPAASRAITAALAFEDAARATELEMHLGLHAGDVIREEGNVFGGAVNIAARISALSAPGEVLVSRTVADLARTSAGVTFEDRGEHQLKGIAEAQRLFSVRPA